MRLYRAATDEIEIYRIKNAMQRLDWMRVNRPIIMRPVVGSSELIAVSEVKQINKLLRVHRDRLNELRPNG